jgi:class III lanthionine synthetase
VDRRYEPFCATDPVFFDSMGTGSRGAMRFGIASRPLPAGWQQVTSGEWLVHLPPDCAIPAQGWKIHVSACQSNAGQVLEKAWEYCVPRLISLNICGGHWRC